MSLLPKTHQQFAKTDYWNEFFTRRKTNEFEWYANFEDFWPILGKYVKKTDNILVVGCGNSSLSADLYDVGVVNNKSIDISDVVVRQMNEKYKIKGGRKGLEFIKMDVLQTTFSDGQFNAIIDKGTLDALATDGSASTETTVQKMFAEMSRILSVHGRYVCVSLLQAHVIKAILKWFTNNQTWLVRVHRCHEAEKRTKAESDQDNLVLPVFVVVCTKLSPTSVDNPTKFYDLFFNESIETRSHRLQATVEVIDEVESQQQLAYLIYKIKTCDMKKDDAIFFELFDSSDSANARYTLFFVDHPNRRAKTTRHCAVFIVPNGREVEWMFGTAEGRLQLAKQAGFKKLIVVHLNRNHRYKNLGQIQDELSNRVLDFISKKILIENQKIPFLSVGDDIGTREIVYKGFSQFTGDFIVEDVVVGQEAFRRLIFLNSQNIIQSEAKLRFQKNGNNKNCLIDHKFLACRHHEVIVCGLSLLPELKMKHLDMMLIGLGGGCLPNFIQNNAVKADLDIDVVEIDEVMQRVATEWFDLKNQNDRNNVRITVHIEDGIEFVDKQQNKKEYDYIVLDVDSKSQEEGMSCPPAAFVSREFLCLVKKLLQGRSGLFILNLVCRNKKVKNEIYETIKSVFTKVFVYSIKDEINEIVFCFVNEDIVFPKSFEKKNNELTKNNLFVEAMKSVYSEVLSEIKTIN